MKTILYVLFVLACGAVPVVSVPLSTCVTSTGLHIADGYTFKATPCELCTCHIGHLTCGVQDCALPNCESYTTPPGQCCPVCQSVKDSVPAI
uniref:VWFC domain-containing protein n=1 Tax=Biomphalaria glabrata TaxID=6526 RepID=A0A2C9LMD4_BIOGL